MNVAVIGYGGRGAIYAGLFKKFKAKITAVCDTNLDRINQAKNKLDLKDNQLFESEDTFFSSGKLADVCVIATQDKFHRRHALKAIQAGYDLLLEKPIATNIEDCNVILEAAKKSQKKVFVCHVLRYTPFFQNIKKELDSGEYGDIVTINHTENVSYWHYAHSYIRGNWNNSEESSPMIIAKSCHDLDILSWLIGKKCLAVSSFGSLSYFKKSNAPEDSSDRCISCKLSKTCEFSAERLYFDLPHKPFGLRTGNKGWPGDTLTTLDLTEERLTEALKTSKYGKCVYKCDNNVVDHQVVNMLFENEITAHMTMTAFSKFGCRKLHVNCTKGDIYANMDEKKIVCNKFGGDTKIIDVSNDKENGYGHGGGDYYMIKDVVESYQSGNGQNLTLIESSFSSHLIGFSAEESRINEGKVVKI